MKKLSNWQVAAALSALLVLAPACGREDPGEADEMQALLDQDPSTPLADEGEAGGSGGTAADDGYGNVEAEPVDVSGMEPKQPPPAPRPAPRPAPPPAPEPEPEPEGPMVRAGTRIALSSDMELSTENVIPGDAIVATVSDDVLSPEGLILIPRGSKLLGRVVHAQESTGPDVDPVLEIAFETLSTVDFERPIQASVVEVEMEASRKDSDKRTAAKIGGAAAAGAILGKILGKDTEDAVKGGAVGAVAGTVIAMETRSGHAKIKTGALIVVELTRELLVQ